MGRTGAKIFTKISNPYPGEDAFNELIRHFMGDHYYIVDPIHAHQANYVILQEIKKAYPRGSIRIIRDR